jgi:hypothetical protein
VKDLRKTNISLLCKWWWRLENGEGLWQEIVRTKYNIKRGIVHLKVKPSNSPVWNDLIKVKELYMCGRYIQIGNGRDTDFWSDPWCGTIPLKEKFRQLAEICNEQKKSVAEIARGGWRLTFRRWLDENNQIQMRQLRDILTTCALGLDKDKPMWRREKHKRFSVRTMYTHLCRADIENQNKKLWKAKIPLKVKIFMWLLQQNAVLTKDNLAKRNWKGDKRCRFCNMDECINHLFFDCSLARYTWSLVAMVVGADCRPSNLMQFWVWSERFLPRNKNIHMIGLAAICWAVWQSRNGVCFERKNIRSPTEIICLTSYLNYRAGLSKDTMK